MIRLRPFEKGDLDRLHELDRLCFPPGIAYSRQELRVFLAGRGSFSLIAERLTEDAATPTEAPSQAAVAPAAASGGNRRIEGFLIAETVRIQGRLAGHVLTIDVDPAVRRSGLGRRLMMAAEEEFLRRGLGRIRLEAAENNASALSFYRGLGYAATGHIPDYYPGGLAAVVLEKSLPPAL